MYLEIVTPEAVLLSTEVESVRVPGINGEFQMLNNHAPIVSVLVKGEVKVATNSKTSLPKKLSSAFRKEGNMLVLPVEGGVIELKDNKIIVLAD